MVKELKTEKTAATRKTQVAASSKPENEIRPQKPGFWRRNKNTLILMVISIILTFTLTTLFSPLSKLYDSMWASHPDTSIYHISDENNTLGNSVIVVFNSGNADDSVRIQIQTYYLDSIEKIEFSAPKEIKLTGGGIGQNYAVLVIDKLWPQAIDLIYINTLLKKGAVVIVAYSESQGQIKIESRTDLLPNIQP